MSNLALILVMPVRCTFRIQAVLSFHLIQKLGSDWLLLNVRDLSCSTQNYSQDPSLQGVLGSIFCTRLLLHIRLPVDNGIVLLETD